MTDSADNGSRGRSGLPFEELAGVDFSIVFFGVFAIGSGLTENGFSETVVRGLLDRRFLRHSKERTEKRNRN